MTHSPDESMSLLPVRLVLTMFIAMVTSALLIFWIGALTDMDIWLADAFYDSGAKTFPWRHAWVTERVGHQLFRTILIGLGIVVIAVAMGEHVLRKPYLSPWWRLRLRLMAACAVMIPLATSMLKYASKSHCPWDLERYGGLQQYYRLLEQVPAWVDAGRCLPGGHASAALWLVGAVVFWLPEKPRVALFFGSLSLLLGGGLGWLQQMRGAHFLTHTLWSMWIACAVTYGLLLLQMRVFPGFARTKAIN